MEAAGPFALIGGTPYCGVVVEPVGEPADPAVPVLPIDPVVPDIEPVVSVVDPDMEPVVPVLPVVDVPPIVSPVVDVEGVVVLLEPVVDELPRLPRDRLVEVVALLDDGDVVCMLPVVDVPVEGIVVWLGMPLVLMEPLVPIDPLVVPPVEGLTCAIAPADNIMAAAAAGIRIRNASLLLYLGD